MDLRQPVCIGTSQAAPYPTIPELHVRSPQLFRRLCCLSYAIFVHISHCFSDCSCLVVSISMVRFTWLFRDTQAMHPLLSLRPCKHTLHSSVHPALVAEMTTVTAKLFSLLLT